MWVQRRATQVFQALAPWLECFQEALPPLLNSCRARVQLTPHSSGGLHLRSHTPSPTASLTPRMLPIAHVMCVMLGLLTPVSQLAHTHIHYSWPLSPTPSPTSPPMGTIRPPPVHGPITAELQSENWFTRWILHRLPSNVAHRGMFLARVKHSGARHRSH